MTQLPIDKNGIYPDPGKAPQVSVGPAGEEFPLPGSTDYDKEFRRDCEVKGLGRGHIQRIKEEIKGRKHKKG